MASECEKMVALQWYTCRDPELLRMQEAARYLIQAPCRSARARCWGLAYRSNARSITKIAANAVPGWKWRSVSPSVSPSVARSGLAAAQFGQAFYGVADYPLMQLRRKVAGLVGHSVAGEGPNLVLVGSDAAWGSSMDPAFAAHTDPIVH